MLSPQTTDSTPFNDGVIITDSDEIVGYIAGIEKINFEPVISSVFRLTASLAKKKIAGKAGRRLLLIG